MSKLDGVSLRVNLTNYKGCRLSWWPAIRAPVFFPPESGGRSSIPDLPSECSASTTIRTSNKKQRRCNTIPTLKKLLPYVNFTWRYDSGLVAGSVPDFATAWA